MSATNESDLNTLAINNLREYIQIPSVHPNIDYEPCVKFLQKQALTLGLPIQVFYLKPTKPVVVISWNGSDPTLPSILLNSHMDVVPVDEKKWTYKPFSGHIDEKGNVYGRGTQDMKGIGIQYIEAVRRLKLQGVILKKTIHLSFVPDEEIGGSEGMKIFVESNEFKNLNVGFAMDEARANILNEYTIHYAERIVWHFHFIIPGQSGHGSLLLENTPGEKATFIINKLYEFRKKEQEKLKLNPNLTLGDVTTVNLTKIRGGVQANVIPTEFILSVDCRIAINDYKTMEEILNKWCAEAGQGVHIKFDQKGSLVPPTKLDDTNPYWVAFKKATDEMGLIVKPQVFPGGTDSRYIRSKGIPAIGFSTFVNTPKLLHDNDEHINTDIFLKGINTYTKILLKIANVTI